MKRLLSGFLLLTVTTGLFAQEATPANRHTTHAMMFGTGRSNIYDTYLSPSTYRGPHLNFMRETLRPTHWADGRVSVQTLLDGYLAYTKTNTASSHELSGMINYTAGWHYNWQLRCGLRLMAGGGIHGALGAIYNMRNSNNPVQAQAQIYLSASGMAIYPFHIGKQPFTARYQLTVPLIGAMFSPQYGQSYYEMSLGNYDHNVCFTYPVNAPSMRHLLTVDFPINKLTFRVGYLCDIRQSTVNNIDAHLWNHSFMVGYVKHFTFVRCKEPQHQSFIM